MEQDKNEIKVADIVICIDDRGWAHGASTRLNKAYAVLAIAGCSCDRSFDIGLRYDDSRAYTICRKCGDMLDGNGIHWAGQFRFRKATPEEEAEYYKENKGAIQAQIEACVAVENYEKAAELYKLIK